MNEEVLRCPCGKEAFKIIFLKDSLNIRCFWCHKEKILLSEKEAKE
jgi:hypothetical protein